MWDTHRERLADTVTWYPQHVSMPITSPTHLCDCRNPQYHQSPAPSISWLALSPLADSKVAFLHSLANILLNRTDCQADNSSVPTIKQTPVPALRVPATASSTVPPVQQVPTKVPTPAHATGEQPRTRRPPFTTSEGGTSCRTSHHLCRSQCSQEAPQPTTQKSTAKKLENDLHWHRTLGNSPNEAASLPPQVQLIANTSPTTKSEQLLQQAFAAIHSDTGGLVEYQKLLKSSDGHLWEQSCVEEITRLAQGCPLAGIPASVGTNTLFFIKLKDIPAGRKATYLRIVVTGCPQMENPHLVCFTVGGNQIVYPGNISTKTAGLATAKILFNSAISTDDARFMTMDMKDFYLYTMMARYEHMNIHKRDIPKLFGFLRPRQPRCQ
jgi:hypothetical protein